MSYTKEELKEKVRKAVLKDEELRKHLANLLKNEIFKLCDSTVEDHCEKNPKEYYYNDDLSEVKSKIINELKKRLKYIFPLKQKSGVEFSLDSELPQETILYSSTIAQKISPLVLKARKQIFGEEELPKDAVTWIEEEAKKETIKTTKATFLLEKAELEKALNKRVETFKKTKSIFFEEPFQVRVKAFLGAESETLKYPPKKGEWVKAVPVSLERKTKLSKLKGFAKEISEITGWQEAQAVAHIFTDKIPIISPIKVIVHTSRNKYLGLRASVSIVINARNIGYRDFLLAYKKFKEIIGRPPKKKFTKKHLALRDLVEEYKEDKNITYKKLQKIWNEEYPKWAYKDKQGFHGIAKAIKRLVAKLGDDSFLPEKWSKKNA